MTTMNNNQGEVGEAVPAGQRSSWMTFIKSLAAFSGDLSSLTAPPFILSPVSLTEFPAYWCERPELFAQIVTGKDEETRAFLVLKWFISTLKGQYTSRNENLGSEKKPLNPVLGELFFGVWPDKDGRGETKLIVEQVSHHPPVTAYHIENASKGLILHGHCAQKTSFSAGSIIVKQIGHAILDIKLPDGTVENYLITLPTLQIQGLWMGAPYTELSQTSWIQSSTGWQASIEYKGRGYFSGKAHTFKAVMSKLGATSPSIIEGQWDSTSLAKTPIRLPGVLEPNGFFTDVTGPKEEVTVKPVEEQEAWETRRLWKVVAAGIRKGDFEIAAKDKSRIENEQRQRRRDELADGTRWELRYFKHVDRDLVYEELGQLFGIQPAVEDTYTLKETPLPPPHYPEPNGTNGN